MPLSPRTLAALLAAADRLDRAGVDWLLAGSAARALLGLAARPADLDLEVPGEGAPAAAAALSLVLSRDAGGGRASWRGRCRIAGVEVDLTGDLEVRGPGGRLAPDFALQRAWAHTREVAGRRIRLAPVEEAVARAVVLADWRALARVAGEARDGREPVALRTAYLSRRLSSATASAAR
jgi:hypothetical protein